jgi:hypothetical protein
MSHQTKEYSADHLSHSFYARQIRGCRGRPSRPAFKQHADGCVIWDGAVNSKGYALAGEGLVHRAAWEAIIGPIPPDHDIHHLCRNKLCSRIDHLACMSHEAHAILERRTPKLDESKVRHILRLITEGAPHAEIASDFGISRSYVSLLKFGRRWATVVYPFWEAMGVWPSSGGRHVPSLEMAPA